LTNKPPKLSIITVSLNSAATIGATINSILNQTFTDFEYLVLDGGSIDGTVEILQANSEHGKLIYNSEKDNGIYDAMNKGLKQARGEWIYFIGSDDVLYSEDVLEKIFAMDSADAQVIYGNVQLLHSGKIYDGLFDHEKLSQNNICHQAMFVKKSLYERIGGFNNKYPIAADYEFNMKWMGMGIPSFYTTETVAIYNEQGLSFDVWDKQFHFDRDILLVQHGIVCKRSFDYLKQKNQQLVNSQRFRIGDRIVSPIAKIVALLKKR